MSKRDYRSEMITMLTEFHEAFGYDTDPALRKRLQVEEARELLSATTMTDRLKEACDYLYVMIGTIVCFGNNTEELMDAEFTKDDPFDFGVCMYATCLTNKLSASLGYDTFMLAFERVHKSNMSKLGTDGKPIFRDDGKRLKGPNYKPVDLSDLILDQSTLSTIN